MMGLWMGTRQRVCLTESGSHLCFSSAERRQKIISRVTPAAPGALAVLLRSPTEPFVVGTPGTSVSPWNQDSELKPTQMW